jgi:hypothetical protein
VHLIIPSAEPHKIWNPAFTEPSQIFQIE